MNETVATYTPNINLEKAGRKQRYDIGVFNANFDKIDKAVGDNKLLANGKENIGVAKQLVDALGNRKEDKGVAKRLDDALKTEILNSVLSVKDFPLDKAENGWAKLPNGLIIQWGISAYAFWEERIGYIIFPIEFPNKCISMQMTGWLPNEDGSFGIDAWFQVKKGKLHNANAEVMCQSPSSATFHNAIHVMFLAIGY